MVAAISRNNKLIIPNVVTKLKEGVSVIGKVPKGTSQTGSGFTDIVIPESVKRLETDWDRDFFITYVSKFISAAEGHKGRYGCLYFKGTKPPKLEKHAMLADITVYVPAKAYDAYKKELKSEEYRLDLRKMK